MLQDALDEFASWDARTWVAIASAIVAVAALWRSERRARSDRRESRAETDLKLMREELAEVIKTIEELQLLTVDANQHLVTNGGGGERGIAHERQTQALKYRIDRHQSVLTILVGETFALAIVLEPIKELRAVARQLYDMVGAVNRAGITAAVPGLTAKHDERATKLVRARTAVVEAARQLSRDTSWSRQPAAHDEPAAGWRSRLAARLRRAS